MHNNIDFDAGSSAAFQAKLDTGIQDVFTELNRMEVEISRCRAWWKGGSEESFIQSFRKTRKRIEKDLKNCMDDYKKMVRDVQRDKEREEADISRAVRNATQ